VQVAGPWTVAHAPARARGPCRRLGFCLALSNPTLQGVAPLLGTAGSLRERDRGCWSHQVSTAGQWRPRKVKEVSQSPCGHASCISMTSQEVKVTSLFFSPLPLPLQPPPEADAAADENENNMKAETIQPTKTAVGNLRQSAIARSRERRIVEVRRSVD
jgi:hypothetical protein